MADLVNMHEAKSNLSRLVKRAANGERILIANQGKPVAMLSRIPRPSKKLPWDLCEGEIEMAEDFDAPFDGFTWPDRGIIRATSIMGMSDD